ncbi:MAG: gamma-glutamyltransferase family protein [Alphaproteobacteria bacterium]
MNFTTRPEIRGTFGVVTSTHWLASMAGMAMLERGGNAFDAAVATAFALQVVEPHLNGPGGDVTLLFHSARDPRPQVLCGQGPAPAGATIEHYRSHGLELVPGTGLLAAVVPGAFGAWMTLLRDHGTMRLADVMEPALGYASRGYPLLPRIAEVIGGIQELFETEWPSSAAVYLPQGRPPAPNELFANADLARTYRRIVTEAEAATPDRDAQIEAARQAFYEGFVAEAIDRFCAGRPVMDSSGRRHKGVLAGDDLARWTPSYEAPVALDYEGYRVCKAGPWSQGPVFLQQLALLAGFDLGAMDTVDARFVHTVTECAKLAFADREAYYGDPDFADVPLGTLLEAGYTERRRRLVAEAASLELRPGEIEGYAGAIPGLKEAVPISESALAGTGEPTMGRRGAATGDTCHLDVCDRFGNVVSATPSGGWLHSSPIIPELGFCLSTRAQMFWLEPGHPASLEPGKRPRTTLSPTLAYRDGEAALAFGTPGGDYQDQWSVVLFLRLVHHGMNLQEGIDAPLFHMEHFPSSFFPRTLTLGSLTLESRFSEETVAELMDRGHRVDVAAAWSVGRLCAVGRDGDVLKAAATPRLMQAYAVGR